MKQFVTSNTGTSQTLAPTVDEKVKIYDSYANAVSCIACLAEGEIVATKSGNPLDMDAVKAYIANQVTLSDQVEITFPYTTCYDGYIAVVEHVAAGGNYMYITVTDGSGVTAQYGGSTGSGGGGGLITDTVTVPVKKGDEIKVSASQGLLSYQAFARLYCDRDYTGR